MKDLFQLSLTKKLDFILTGASVSDCTREMVYEQPVEFRDNLMEGFVKFKVQVENKNNGLLFKIDMMGTNRVKYLEPRL